MPTSSAERAYAAFLRGSDTTTWMACLRSLGGADAADDDLVKVLVIATYVQWLGTQSGEQSATREAEAMFKAASARLVKLHRERPSAQTATGMAITLSIMGYTAAGKAYLVADELGRPEIALLFEPGDPARTSAALRDFVVANPAEVFRPAFWRYCAALLRLSAIEELGKLLGPPGADEDGPIIEVRGAMHEQAGQWRQALAAYRSSKWPEHVYRAAVCTMILRGSERAAEAESPSPAITDIDDRQLRLSSAEIDQVELARTTAFVNVCRWHSYDSWLIRLEMGKLAFRRRRYLEAEGHFRQAAASAPPGKRYPILDLRLSSLSWMTDQSSTRALALKVESIAAAREALRCAEQEQRSYQTDELASVRTLLAQWTDDKTLLAPVIEGAAAYWKGSAAAMRGDLPAAIDCWLAAMQMGYQHRITVKLLYYCYASELQDSARFLAHMILGESWDDFFVLWELARAMRDLGAGNDDGSGGGAWAGEASSRLRARLEELSQLDYQNLIRAHEFFRSVDEDHIAEALLDQAARLADGAEENLAVAVARRLYPRVGEHEIDRQGLSCLQRAERESRDRLERLEIAREHFHYSQPARGRTILREEGIVDRRPGSGRLRLRLIEFVAALQCGPWLTVAELEALVDDALEALRQEQAAGLPDEDLRFHVERLWKVVAVANEALAMRLQDRFWALKADAGPKPATPPSPAARVIELAPWDAWLALIEPNDEFSAERLLAPTVTLAEHGSIGTRIAMWRSLRNRMLKDAENAGGAMPHAPASRTPVAKSRSLIDLRTQTLCDLWKRSLAEGSGMQELTAFYDEEAMLLARWEAARRDAESASMQRARGWSALGRAVLATLRRPIESTEHHPYFDGFYRALAADAERLEAALARGNTELGPEAPL